MDGMVHDRLIVFSCDGLLLIHMVQRSVLTIQYVNFDSALLMTLPIAILFALVILLYILVELVNFALQRARHEVVYTSDKTIDIIAASSNHAP